MDDAVRDALAAIPATMPATRSLIDGLAPLLVGDTKPTPQAVEDLAGLVPVLAGAVIGLENRVNILEGRDGVDLTAVFGVIAAALPRRT
jgi:hypothetical protein